MSQEKIKHVHTAEEGAMRARMELLYNTAALEQRKNFVVKARKSF
jgi:hypothetical protein